MDRQCACCVWSSRLHTAHSSQHLSHDPNMMALPKDTPFTTTQPTQPAADRCCCWKYCSLSRTSVAAGRGNLARLQGGLVWSPCLLCLNQTWDTVSNVAGEAMVGPNQEGTGSPAHLQEGVIPWNAAATQRVRETTLIVEREKPMRFACCFWDASSHCGSYLIYQRVTLG